jgi:DNA-binding MarR family transcriptional regulator
MNGGEMEYNKLGILFKFIDNSIETSRNNLLQGTDITAAQADILTFLLFNQDRELNQRDIEQEFQIKHPTVTGLLDRLENKGFVRRTVPQGDGRCRHITLTKKYLKISKKILEKAEALEHRLTRGFSEEEQAQLQSLLQRVLKNVKDK